jgi:predicted transcriptional regulator
MLKQEIKRLSIRVQPQLDAQLRKLANEEDRTLSKFIELILQDFVKKQNKK